MSDRIWRGQPFDGTPDAQRAALKRARKEVKAFLTVMLYASFTVFLMNAMLAASIHIWRTL